MRATGENDRDRERNLNVPTIVNTWHWLNFRRLQGDIGEAQVALTGSPPETLSFWPPGPTQVARSLLVEDLESLLERLALFFFDVALELSSRRRRLQFLPTPAALCKNVGLLNAEVYVASSLSRS